MINKTAKLGFWGGILMIVLAMLHPPPKRGLTWNDENPDQSEDDRGFLFI